VDAPRLRQTKFDKSRQTGGVRRHSGESKAAAAHAAVGPIRRSIGGTHTTPVDERLGESCNAFHGFGFCVDRIDGAAVLATVRHDEAPFGGREPTMVFGRADEVLLLRLYQSINQLETVG
jgi:hypothetical protein